MNKSRLRVLSVEECNVVSGGSSPVLDCRIPIDHGFPKETKVILKKLREYTKKRFEKPVDIK